MLLRYHRYPNATTAALYTIIGFLLKGSWSDLTFLSDDFQVIYRIPATGTIFIKGFFRPVSDLTLLINYQLGGYRPAGYFLLNLAIHIGCSYQLYRFIVLTKGIWHIDHPAFPFIGGLLFLVYPYHGEALFWVVGRGASLASLFALLALNYSLSSVPSTTKLIIVATLYFLGSGAYESVLFFPILLLIIHFYHPAVKLAWRKWMFVLGAVLLVHLMLRVLISGSVLGDYAGELFAQETKSYAGNLFRILARLYVPPMASTAMFLVVASITGLLLGIGIYRCRADLSGSKFATDPFVALLLLLTVSLLVPLTFPVSTHTSETDRLLYFPSVWASLFLTLLVFKLTKTQRSLLAGCSLLILIAAVLFQQNARHWRQAYATVRSIMSSINMEQAAGRETVWVNLPGEFQGAYIFRHGFNEALAMEKLDTALVKTINILDEKDHDGQPLNPSMDLVSGELSIPPSCRISKAPSGNISIRDTKGNVYIIEPSHAALYFWNMEKVQRLSWPAQ
jgi:hypothetical protein